MADRKWKEGKQQPSMLLGSAVPGSSLVSFYFRWAILCPQAVYDVQESDIFPRTFETDFRRMSICISAYHELSVVTDSAAAAVGCGRAADVEHGRDGQEGAEGQRGTYRRRRLGLCVRRGHH